MWESGDDPSLQSDVMAEEANGCPAELTLSRINEEALITQLLE